MKCSTGLILRRLAHLIPLSTWLLAPASAMAMPEGMEENIADVVVWIVIVLVPIGALYLIWKLHILPEVIAEKRQHPQKGAIQVLCLLSLVFGGLLWPIAWLWAYTKPTNYKLAYGTDKHDDFFLKPDGEHNQTPTELAIVEDELAQLKEKLEGLEKKRALILNAQDKPAQEQHHA